jgi:hypothetical protein
MKCLIRLFFILIFFTGCIFNTTPKGIIHKSEMISLLTDIHLVDAYAGMLGQDTVKQPAANLYNSVFIKHHTDSVQFRKSLEYYSREPQKFSDMYQKVQENLVSLDSEMVRKYRERVKAKQ